MNWNNIDLTSPYELDQPILDSYDCKTILLEVACNIKDITRESVRRQAIESIKNKYETALEILEANLDNLTKEALRERAIP
jgi:SUMO ligase MMS21 Smc5/6 complex component